MGLWESIFLVLGCALAGLGVGLAIMYAFQRKRAKQISVLQKEIKFGKKETPEASATAALNSILPKSNGHEDPLESLIKSRKINGTAESRKQSTITDLPAATAFTDPQNDTVPENAEKPAETKAINWTELILPHNEPVTPKEPVTVNRKNTIVADEPVKSSASGGFKTAEIARTKTTQVHEAPKKPAKAAAVKKPEVVTARSTPVVKEPKKPVKPVSREPELTYNEGAPVIEEYAEPPKPSVLEPEIFMSESIAAAEKREESSKSTVWESEPAKLEDIPPVQKPVDAAKSDFILELENNLAVATMPWSDKLTSFQTKCWDTKHGEYEPLLTAHHQELIQLYVDIGLANNIVWLATEIGHRSKELDESYVKLCDGIAESIKRIMPSLNDSGL
jgi:hypothetical protein